MAAKQKIHFIITGGTIDSYYEGSKDTVIPNEHSVLPKYLKSLKLYEDFAFTEICMKDSRDITQKDVKKIFKAIEKSRYKRIIVPHGTYTVPDTARYVAANLKNNKEKVIIFVGSMIPLIGFSPSDAPFNLGFAIAKLQDLEPGVYICMNGRVFSTNEIVKTLSEGRFTSTFGER